MRIKKRLKKGKKKNKSSKTSRAQVKAELSVQCKAISGKLFAELERIALNPQVDKYTAALKLGAIKEMLDRGFGKPAQTIESTIEDRKILEIVIQTPDGTKTVAKRIFPKS